ncbi:hypothetical protein ACIRPR_06445 [Streptomyces griseoflavus]|uniref:hypothetical protein n=1 Tax=Streptomyces griseoflavus TaxID=35619 RepID=UPI00380A78EC
MTRPAADLTDEQREQLLANVAQLHTALARYVEALRPQLEAIGRAFADLGQQLHAAGLIDADGNPTRTDRPAWQSPYGPAPRRR